jgi:hypothetical protein
MSGKEDQMKVKPCMSPKGDPANGFFHLYNVNYKLKTPTGWTKFTEQYAAQAIGMEQKISRVWRENNFKAARLNLVQLVSVKYKGEVNDQG